MSGGRGGINGIIDALSSRKPSQSLNAPPLPCGRGRIEFSSYFQK